MTPDLENETTDPIVNLEESAIKNDNILNDEPLFEKDIETSDGFILHCLEVKANAQGRSLEDLLAERNLAKIDGEKNIKLHSTCNYSWSGGGCKKSTKDSCKVKEDCNKGKAIAISQKDFGPKKNWPYKIRQPGNYYLTGNIVFAPRDIGAKQQYAIDALTDNFTLKFCGFTISQCNDVPLVSGVAVERFHECWNIDGGNGCIKNFTQFGLWVKGGNKLGNIIDLNAVENGQSTINIFNPGTAGVVIGDSTLLGGDPFFNPPIPPIIPLPALGPENTGINYCSDLTILRLKSVRNVGIGFAFFNTINSSVKQCVFSQNGFDSEDPLNLPFAFGMLSTHLIIRTDPNDPFDKGVALEPGLQNVVFEDNKFDNNFVNSTLRNPSQLPHSGTLGNVWTSVTFENNTFNGNGGTTGQAVGCRCGAIFACRFLKNQFNKNTGKTQTISTPGVLNAGVNVEGFHISFTGPGASPPPIVPLPFPLLPGSIREIATQIIGNQMNLNFCKEDRAVAEVSNSRVKGFIVTGASGVNPIVLRGNETQSNIIESTLLAVFSYGLDFGAEALGNADALIEDHVSSRNSAFGALVVPGTTTARNRTVGILLSGNCQRFRILNPTVTGNVSEVLNPAPDATTPLLRQDAGIYFNGSVNQIDPRFPNLSIGAATIENGTIIGNGNDGGIVFRPGTIGIQRNVIIRRCIIASNYGYGVNFASATNRDTSGNILISNNVVMECYIHDNLLGGIREQYYSAAVIPPVTSLSLNLYKRNEAWNNGPTPGFPEATDSNYIVRYNFPFPALYGAIPNIDGTVGFPQDSLYKPDHNISYKTF